MTEITVRRKDTRFMLVDAKDGQLCSAVPRAYAMC
jgi:hypothetical protein